MLKKAAYFTLSEPAKTHGDTIDLGGGVKAVLKMLGRDLISWNGFRDMSVCYVKFDIVDDQDNVFCERNCQLLLGCSNKPLGMTEKGVQKLINKENTQRQETVLKSLLEKLPDIIRLKMADNLRQNEFFQKALGNGN